MLLFYSFLLFVRYLQFKSWQRFCETFALLERGARLGLMEGHRPGGRFHERPVRVFSIGGGPGYELLAFERFFRRYLLTRYVMEALVQ